MSTPKQNNRVMAEVMLNAKYDDEGNCINILRANRYLKENRPRDWHDEKSPMWDWNFYTYRLKE